MKSISLHRPWHSLMAAFLIPLLAFLLACGPGEEPTPIPTATTAPTATPTQAPASVPTLTSPGPAAIPTPTTQAAPAPTTALQPRRGGVMNHIVSGYPPNWDIHVTGSGNSDQGTNWYARLFNNLFIVYEGDVPECDVCREWRFENNGLTIVADLIEGIKFHSGQEMTSADVAYSLRMIMGEVDGIVSPRPGGIKEYIKSIETPSKYQVRINLVRPSTQVMKLMSYAAAGIVPNGTTRAETTSAPRGSGPFIIKQAALNASIEFARNPNYFKSGLPYLDGIKQTVVADVTTRQAAFLVGKTNYIGATPSAQFKPKFQELLDNGLINVREKLNSCGNDAVYFNLTKPPFDNIQLRRAVNLALDRVALATIAYPGEKSMAQLLYFVEGQEYGQRESEIWNVALGWGTGAKKQQEIEQARALVKQAGYPNGLDVPMLARGPITSTGFSATHEPTQRMLTDVGIRVTLDPVDPITHLIRMPEMSYLLNNYLFCIPSGDADEVVGGYWITGGSRNWTGYTNPEVDRLFPLMSGELDPAKRKDLFLRIRDLILKDVPHAPRVVNNGYGYWWGQLQGFTRGMDLTHANTGFFRADRLWLLN